MRRGQVKPEERAVWHARLARALQGDPDLTPPLLAQRLGLSHVTVRKYLRELGLYKPVGVARERQAQVQQ